MKRSFYEMLDVPRKATKEQIDEAYARVTEKLGATTSMRGTADSLTQLNMIREGYKILSDPEKRAMYDAKLYATEAGITLMFFPKDTKAVKKLGIDTMIFTALACVFTYVVYQKLTHEANPVRVEQATAGQPTAAVPKAEVSKADLPKAGAPSQAAPPAEPPANAPDAKGIAKADQK
jgi:hypothetical protein